MNNIVGAITNPWFRRTNASDGFVNSQEPLIISVYFISAKDLIRARASALPSIGFAWTNKKSITKFQAHSSAFVVASYCIVLKYLKYSYTGAQWILKVFHHWEHRPKAIMLGMRKVFEKRLFSSCPFDHCECYRVMFRQIAQSASGDNKIFPWNVWYTIDFWNCFSIIFTWLWRSHVLHYVVSS